MNRIVTRGYGPESKIVTRGYGGVGLGIIWREILNLVSIISTRLDLVSMISSSFGLTSKIDLEEIE